MAGFPEVGGEFGTYRITGVLGRGGMGIVYQAVQSPLNRPVALKVLDPRLASDPTFVARFSREAEVLAAMDSPHIIRIFDHGEVDGRLFLATQSVEGGDLSDLIRREGAMRPAAALDLAAQVAAALADAHARGVIHRDIKPSNVLVHAGAEGPFAYLCDFGIAQSQETGMTQTGLVAGSWAFMAPERHQGGAATPQSDIYSLGCVLWCLLTGRNPYAGTDVQMAMAHASAPVPQLPGSDQLSLSLNRILHLSMAKAPEHRYPSANAMVADLRSAQASFLAADAGVSAPGQEDLDERTHVRPAPGPRAVGPTAVRQTRPADPAPPVTPPSQRARAGALLAVGAMVVVVAIVAGLLAWWPRPASVAASGLPVEPPVPATVDPPSSSQPGPGYVCWNGDRADDLLDCTDPRDASGVKYLYPSMQDMSSRCARRELTTVDGIVYECFFGQDELIRYRWYQDEDVARLHYEESYADVAPRPFLVDGEEVGTLYQRNGREKGVYRMSVLWHRDHFAFSVEAPTRARQRELLDLVRVRAVADLRGYAQGSGPREGVIG